MRSNLAIVLVLSVCPDVKAQLAWQQLQPMVQPTAEDTVRLAYVDASKTTLLFGGYVNGGNAVVGETWSWNGSVWSKLAPGTSPSPRVGHALCYDRAPTRVVRFGGRNLNAPLRETWEWDGTTWTQRVLAVQPTAEDNANMAYDAARARVVLFGGFTGNQSTYLDETWEFDGVA